METNKKKTTTSTLNNGIELAQELCSQDQCEFCTLMKGDKQPTIM